MYISCSAGRGATFRAADKVALPSFSGHIGLQHSQCTVIIWSLKIGSVLRPSFGLFRPLFSRTFLGLMCYERLQRIPFSLLCVIDWQLHNLAERMHTACSAIYTYNYIYCMHVCVCVCTGIYIGYLLLLQFVPQGCARCELSQEAKNKISLARRQNALSIAHWQMAKDKKGGTGRRGGTNYRSTATPEPLITQHFSICVFVFTVKNCANEQLLLA